MASEDAVYDAAFQRVGLARVFQLGEIFDCAALIGRNKNPRGPNLLKRIVAQTTADNAPMISVFKKRGFQITIGNDSTVDVVKELHTT